MADDSTISVVIDIGSAISKAGLAGDPQPRTVFPTIIGTNN